MRPARCDRSREAISFRQDGALSTFEAVLLERHLRRCASCREFAQGVNAQTSLLRGAALEEPCHHVALPASRRRSLRRAAGGVLTAAAAMSAVAAFTVTPGGGRQAQSSATSATSEARTGPMVMMVVPAQPTPGMSETVPRLTMLPAAVADGPVHGLFSTPVRI